MKKVSGGSHYHQRIRFDSGQHRRILAVALLLGMGAFVPIGFRLYRLMVTEYDYYAAKALRNQTRTTLVSERRGEIYDRNMNILATSLGVETVYLDPHELKQAREDTQDIARVLGELLEKDPAWILEQTKDFKQRYKQIAAGVSEETAGKIRDYINEKDISGIHLEPNAKRLYPYGPLAAQVIGFTNADRRGSEGVEAAYDS